MYKFQDNTRTQLAMDEILGMDTQALEEELPGIEYLDSFEHSTPFRDGIDAQIRKLGYAGAMDNTQGKINFILEQFKKHQIDPISKPTLKNWLTASAPDDKGRENVYKLCFALEMDARQTAEFFHKNYLTRPFNYKKTSEAVYFYCLLNGRSYADALRLIEFVNTQPKDNSIDRDIVTENLGIQISKIDSEEKLVAYLAAHCYEPEEQHRTVTEKIEELLRECYAAAELEMSFRGNPCKVDSDDHLLDIIFDYDSAAMEKEKLTIKASRLPKALKANWPHRQLLFRIKNHDVSTEDVYRKALELLSFYDYYARAYAAERRKKGASVDLRGYADEFETELDQRLAECGYVQIYPRNPFDWLLLFCTCSHDPLDKFREVLAEYYLDEVDATEV